MVTMNFNWKPMAFYRMVHTAAHPILPPKWAKTKLSSLYRCWTKWQLDWSSQLASAFHFDSGDSYCCFVIDLLSMLIIYVVKCFCCCQALKVLRTAEYAPYVVFIAAPNGLPCGDVCKTSLFRFQFQYVVLSLHALWRWLTDTSPKVQRLVPSNFSNNEYLLNNTCWTFFT
jgi:hypothetical protein